MDLIRRNMFYIIVAVAALGGIALAVTGLAAMPKVVKQMDTAKKVYQDLEAAQRGPVNQEALAVQERRIELTRTDFDQLLEKARSLYDYQPLVPDVFPLGGDEELRKFRTRYGQAMDELFQSLNSGEPATPNDVEAMQDRIENELANERGRSLDSGEQPESRLDGPARDAAGVLTKAGARVNAASRANTAVAQSFYCYAVKHGKVPTPRYVPSLDFDVYMIDTGTVDAPEAADAWRAQVKYWLVKDAVEAIVAVNNEAAENTEEHPWVGNLPVKDIISIRVNDEYVLPDAGDFEGAAAEGFGEALPPGSAEKVFTETVSNADYEAIQFTLKLVMDQRDIPRLVKELTTNTFHTLLRVAYQALPVNRDMAGKIYGSEPAVIVVMDFETVMLGDVFRPLMPPSVCERLAGERYGIVCPEYENNE